jgi:hypothetical protein
MPPFQQLLYFLIRTRATDFGSAVASIAAAHADDALFLRYAALFEHFVLAERFARVDDWDVFLDTEGLCCRYQQAARPPAPATASGLRLADLPADFLDFRRPPWLIDIADNNELDLGVCLLTRKLFCANATGSDLPSIQQVVRRLLGATFSVVLMITGGKATGAYLATVQHDQVIRVMSCYADDHGDENRGFARDDPVRLWPERLKRLEEVILSGGWVTRLTQAQLDQAARPA